MNEKEGGHAIGQVGFWDKMNTMRELRGIASPMSASSAIILYVYVFVRMRVE